MYMSMEKLYIRVTTIPGADCDTNHNLLIAIVKIKLKQTKINKTTSKYNLENIDTKYNVEVKNRFSILQVDGKNHEDLWIDIPDVVIETDTKSKEEESYKMVN